MKSAFWFNAETFSYLHGVIVMYLLRGVTSAEECETSPLSLLHSGISSSSGNQCSNKASFLKKIEILTVISTRLLSALCPSGSEIATDLILPFGYLYGGFVRELFYDFFY